MLTIRSSPRSSNPNRTAAAAASVARPCPQWERPSRQPTSTAGSTSGKKLGTESPVNPASSPVERISTANRPKPSDSHSRSHAWTPGASLLLVTHTAVTDPPHDLGVAVDGSHGGDV